jgi:2-polyprenyl-6-methoxyphenol hydroxylase-like FAD-dependent oxidoreductase
MPAARLAFSGRPGLALAWIVEAGRLALALEEQAASLANVSLQRGAQVLAVDAGAHGARVTLEGGAVVEADLLAGADGPDSAVRGLLGLPAEARGYGETAVVANFDTESEHGNVARQWFRADGVLAWLPLPGRRISIVWSAPDAVARSSRRWARTISRCACARPAPRSSASCASHPASRASRCAWFASSAPWCPVWRWWGTRPTACIRSRARA